MLIVQLFKFGLVGSLGLGIDFCITWLLKERVGANKYWSNAAGFVVAATTNYFLNKYFTFQNNNEEVALQLACFFAIALVGLGCNLVLLYGLQRHTKLSFYVSKMVATALVFIWNFTANSWLTFH